jgi:hypothetical protein
MIMKLIEYYCAQSSRLPIKVIVGSTARAKTCVDGKIKLWPAVGQHMAQEIYLAPMQDQIGCGGCMGVPPLDPLDRKESDHLEKVHPWCRISEPMESRSIHRICWQDLVQLVLADIGVSTNRRKVNSLNRLTWPSETTSHWQNLDVWSDRRCTTHRSKTGFLDVQDLNLEPLLIILSSAAVLN